MQTTNSKFFIRILECFGLSYHLDDGRYRLAKRGETKRLPCPLAFFLKGDAAPVNSNDLIDKGTTTAGVARGTAEDQQRAPPRKLSALFSKALATLRSRVVVPAARLVAVARSAFNRLVCEWLQCLFRVVRAMPLTCVFKCMKVVIFSATAVSNRQEFG